jgi:hypothetical protein
MKSKDWLTYEEATSRLSYNPETGALIWKKMRDSTRIGTEAKCLDVSGYVQINIAGTMVKGHRMAWMLHYGQWPDGHIDHINGVRHDNRISNLRVVTNAINCQNKHAPLPKNKSGFLGVSPSGNRFVASIVLNGKKTHIGRFKEASEAHEAYLKFKRELHEGCTL